MGDMYSDHPIYGLEPPFSRALKQKKIHSSGACGHCPLLPNGWSASDHSVILTVYSIESQFSRKLKETRSQLARARGPPGGGPQGRGLWAMPTLAHGVIRLCPALKSKTRRCSLYIPKSSNYNRTLWLRVLATSLLSRSEADMWWKYVLIKTVN